MRKHYAASLTYSKIGWDDSDDDEIPPDKSGFFGDFHRKVEKLYPI